MVDGQAIFDAHARADTLARSDLENLAFFGVKALVTSAHDGVCGGKAEDLELHFESLVRSTVQGVRATGIACYVALGIPASKIPWHGLEFLVSGLPRWLDMPEVVAISGVGLFRGGAREEEVLRLQCDIARQLRFPLVAMAPERDRERMLRRMLAILQESKLPKEDVLIARAMEQEVSVARALGYSATLGALDPDAAADLVLRLGPEGLILSSDIGEGRVDPLLPERFVRAMHGRGLSRGVIRRVAFANAANFFRVQPEVGSG